jgi:hypothetical protein
MSAQAIRNDLIVTLGNKAVADSTVTKYLRTAQFDITKVHSNPDASSFHLDDSGSDILEVLEESRFHQCASHSSPAHYRVQKTDQLTWVFTMSSSMGTASFVRRSETARR